MERLTSKKTWKEVLKNRRDEYGYSHIWKRLNAIENILGDDYDLNHLLEIVEIDRKWAKDVAPVVHGEWEDVFQNGPCSWSGKCSVCGSRNDIPPIGMAHYCPNCGAKMDLED